jgi:hypothetical protein
MTRSTDPGWGFQFGIGTFLRACTSFVPSHLRIPLQELALEGRLKEEAVGVDLEVCRRMVDCLAHDLVKFCSHVVEVGDQIRKGILLFGIEAEQVDRLLVGGDVDVSGLPGELTHRS